MSHAKYNHPIYDDETLDTMQEVLVIVNSIRNELTLGTKHYNKAGDLLTHPRDILECMVNEGGVTIKPIDGREGMFKEQ